MKTKILLLIVVCAALVSLSPGVIYGQDKPLIVPIGGETTVNINPATYISAVYRWGVGLAALLALAVLMFGAVEYTASAGNVGSRESAVRRIRGAILGLVLLLAASVILRTINSDFGNLRTANVDNSAVVGAQRDRLNQIRDERLDAFYAAAGGTSLTAEDYNAVLDVLDFYDADGRAPIENAGDLAIIQNVNEALMSQQLTRKSSVLSSGGDIDTDPVLLSIENELVASLAEEKVRLTAGDFSRVISGLDTAEKNRLIRKYGL